MYISRKTGNTFLLEVISLTNINCTLDCIYQINGNCSYDIISSSTLCTSSECAYYTRPTQK